MRSRIPGRPYRVDWPEYYVDCAAPDCEEYTLLSNLGQAYSQREAERLARCRRDWDDAPWQCRRGRWYCPQHSPGATRPGDAPIVPYVGDP